MSSTLALLLLVLAFVLPVVGATVLRFLIPHLSANQFYVGAAIVFAVAVGSVLMLARNRVGDVQVGGLTLVLPVSGTDSSGFNFDTTGLPPVQDTTAISSTAPLTATEPLTTNVAAAPTAAPTSEPAATAAPTDAPVPSATVPTEPTAAATATPLPEPTATATPEPEPTVAPTEPPPPPTAAPAARRTYRVKKGDTLRSIAEQFDVSVDAILGANNLTAKQADALRIDQELVIPR